ncbi:MAG TPA: site-2 protease family protein [Gemmatimonadales bacterium]|nr:site-2 protease family protein [Gemmatimonadales bacterium]
MTWTYRIARVAGTDIKVHATFLFLIILALPALRHGGWPAFIEQLLFFLALFLCILLHEFGHILMARRFGVRTPDVILLPIGGVARLERLPDAPKQEFLIALAGPLVTLAIALLLYGWTTLTARPTSLDDLMALESVPFAVALMRVNVLLLAFNLLPAFPMDGGRLLRAVLSHRLGLVRATRIAAGIGQVVAIGFGIVGLLLPNPLLVLVAFFVFLGAGTEAAAVETRAVGEGMRVRDMMITDFRTLPAHATLQEAVEHLLAGEQREFPVVDAHGRVEGLLTREGLIRGLSQRGAGASVAEAMTPGTPLIRVDLGFDEAMERLRASGLRALPVVDPYGNVIGLLTLDNVTDLLLVRRAVRR